MKAIRIIILISLLALIGMGIIGIGINFIPEPGFKWVAILAAIAYSATFAIVAFRIRRTKVLQESYDELRPVKTALGFVLLTYVSYVSFYVTVPALLTEIIGTSANKEFVIEALKQGSGRAYLCPYNLSLKDVTTVFVDSFCVSKEFARQHSAGQSIQLTGKQSPLGFRFENAN